MLTPDLPEEIVIDILSRLPVRSLLRFRCVSKSWHSLISSPDFAQSHLQKTLLSPTLCKSRERVLLNDFPLQSINCNSPEPITDLYHPLLNSGSWVQIVGSCNGLVCLLISMDESLILYNPATRKYRSIELPDGEYKCCAFWFGFDSNLQEYKVVRQVWRRPHRSEFRVQVLRLAGSDQATVCREVCCDHVGDVNLTGVFLNGSFHWEVVDSDHGRRDGIVCFDLAREVFGEMPTPPRRQEYVPWYGLGVLEGCLSVIECVGDVYNVWVMKEYGIRTSWTVFVILPRYIGTEEYYLHCWTLVTFKSKGEVLLEIHRRGWELVIFHLQEGTFETIRPPRRESYEPTVYVESLVSP